MGGQWSDEWGGDNWNYGAESDTGYLRSLATLAPAQVKPIDVSIQYEPLDESIVVPISEFIVESTRKPKHIPRHMKFAEKSDCSCGGHLPTPRTKSSLADYCAAGGPSSCSMATPHDTAGLADFVSAAGRRAPQAVDGSRELSEA